MVGSKNLAKRGRKGIALETAIYVMMVVFLLISTIMYATVNMVDDDLQNSADLSKYNAIDQIGEDYIAHIRNNEPFLPENYTNFDVLIEGSTLTVRDKNGKTVLTVTTESGKIVSYIHSN